MKKTFISDAVSNFFEKFGKIIALHPFYFIIVPFLLSISLSVGLFNIKYNEDIDYLLSSDKGKVYEDKQFIDKIFPMNTSHFFNVLRMTQRPKAPIVYIVNKNGRSMLQKNILSEIQVLDNIIKNITVTTHGKTIGYEDLCGIVNERCFENPISTILHHAEDIIFEKLRFKFPFEIDNFTYSYRVLSINLGGVKTDVEGFIKQANAVRLMYPVDETNDSKSVWIKEWRKEFFQSIKNYKFNYIKVYPCPFLATELEIGILAGKLISLFGAAILLIGSFCVTTFMTNNCVRSKPWMGVAAVVSAGLAIVSSFGLMSIIGVENTSCNLILPFLILAIEIDDAFVVVACWRITDPGDNVENRMGKTYSKSAVSITTTTVTNLISYCVAMTASFPGVRIFCLYAAISVFFTYLFQITFFGGCLALSGYREEKNLHPFTFNPFIKSVKKYNHEKEYYFTKFFGDKVFEFVSPSKTKIFIILLYFVNLGTALWGIMSLNEGINVFSLFPPDSDITRGYQIFYQHFVEYTFPLHVIIKQRLDYSDPRVQKSIDDMMNQFESHPNIAGPQFEISWLKYYQEFQNHPISKYSLNFYNLSEKQDFIDALRQVFFKMGAAKQFSNDIVFNHNYTEIISSRFFLVAVNVSDRSTEYKMITDMEKMVEDSPFSIIVYSYISSIVEQGIIIKQITVQLFWLTALLIFIVFIAFIPNFLCASIVATSVVSTTAEIIGYMSLWGVNLDIISMISLILCIGFCINYPTHMCYAFLISSNVSTIERLKESLHHVVFPIFQSAISTMLVLMLFLYNNMYIYTTFIKIVVIISLETVFHAMLVIPIILCIITEFYNKKITVKPMYDDM